MSKAHARFGPSTLDNLSKCIRFKYQELPDNQEAANEGTLLHEALETGNLEGLNEEQTTAVLAIQNYIDSLKVPLEDWEQLNELRVALDDLTFGTADCVLLHKTEPLVHVIDAKFGRVPAEYSFQVQTYGAALVEQQLKVGTPLRTVTTHVVAPRQGICDSQVQDAQELLTKTRARIEELYERIDDPFNPPTPHEDLCNKCARASRCPALGNVAVSVASKLGLPLPSQFSPDALASLQDRAIAHVLAEALITWGEQIKRNNTDFVIKQGEDLPGYRRVTRSTGLRIPTELTAHALQTLEHVGGIPREMLVESCNLVLGRLTKLIAEDRNLPQGSVKAFLQQTLDGIAEEGVTTYLQRAKRQPDEALLLSLGL